MRSRLKTVTACAILFGVNAIIMLIAVVLQASFVLGGASPKMLILTAFLLILFATTAVGVWNLQFWARVLGSLLSVVGLIYMAAVCFTSRAELLGVGVPEMIGEVIGLILCIIWIGGPIYFLNRPAGAESFRRA